MIDTKELRRLAQAATPGPWGNTDTDPTVINSPYNQLAICYRNSRALTDAKFIAAANPAAISELLDRLEAAEKERDFAKVEIARLHDDIHELTDERDTYKAANNEWIAKTEWVQDELTHGKLPAKYLGMHRADGIKVEIDALRAKLEAAEKSVTEAYQRGYATGQEESEKERDALRAKIESMEKQEPVAWLIATQQERDAYRDIVEECIRTHAHLASNAREALSEVSARIYKRGES